MSLHPVLLEKLNAALAPMPSWLPTRRDALLLAVPGKVQWSSACAGIDLILEPRAQ